MKQRCLFILIFGLMTITALVNPIHAQNIVKIVQSYALIDIDNNLGSINSNLKVYRNENNRQIEIGTLKIRKFQDGKTAAKIISTKNGYNIRVGDFVKAQGDDLFDLFESDVSSHTTSQKRATPPPQKTVTSSQAVKQSYSTPKKRTTSSQSTRSSSSDAIIMKGKEGLPEILMVGIGAKNPTFNESKFPHLNIVYTPGLKSQAKMGGAGKSALSLLGGGVTREVFKGTPKFLEEWWDETDITNHAILFDSEGIASWEGWIHRRDEIVDSEGKGDKKKLKDMIKEVVKKGKKTKIKDKKFKPNKTDAILNMRMPDFEVVSASQSRCSINNLISNGKPTLVMFFQIPPDADLQSAKESGKGKSSGAFLSSMMQGAAGAGWETMFKKFEEQMFNNRIRD